MNITCIRDLAKLIDGQPVLGSLPPLGGELEPIGRVVVNCDDVRQGDVFWGLANDSAHLAEAAFARGAAGVVVAGRDLEPWAGMFSIKVADTNVALRKFARWKASQLTARVILVADAAGSSVAARIESVLNSEFCGTRCSVSDELSALLATLQIGEDDDYAIVEVADQFAKVTDWFASFDLPHVATLHDYPLCQWRATKQTDPWELELLSRLPTRCQTVITDQHRMRRLSSCTNSQTIVVGRGIDCDFAATNVQSKNGQLRFSIEDVEFRVPAWGRQQVDEVLTACAVAQCFGIPLTKTASILAQSRDVATNHIIETKTGLIIDRSGVPSFQAVLAGLDELRESTSPSRRVAIVGQGMTDDDDRNCQLLGESLVTRAGVNLLIGCGPSSKVVLQAAGEAGLPPEHAVWCNETKELQQLTSSLMTPLPERSSTSCESAGRNSNSPQHIGCGELAVLLPKSSLRRAHCH
ncbi:MAG: hypothetical protein IH991_24325, partial [Planctomycetes bacterium]|nr:hypothetical protein [Planctomycetota bacterium]